MTDTKRNTRLKGLDGALRRMFGALQARPTPDRLRSVVEQLDDGEPQEVPSPRKRAS